MGPISQGGCEWNAVSTSNGAWCTGSSHHPLPPWSLLSSPSPQSTLAWCWFCLRPLFSLCPLSTSSLHMSFPWDTPSLSERPILEAQNQECQEASAGERLRGCLTFCLTELIWNLSSQRERDGPNTTEQVHGGARTRNQDLTPGSGLFVLPITAH